MQRKQVGRLSVSVTLGIALLALGLLGLGLFHAPQPVAAQISIPPELTTYTQNFDSLTNTGTTNPFTNNVTLEGWYSNRTVYIGDAGTSSTGGLHSYGVISTVERALGSLGSGSANPVLYGVRLRNDSGVLITSFVITYTGEQWRSGGVTNTLEFAYQVGSVFTDVNAGIWTRVPAFDFVGPVTATTAGPLDGNDSANQRIFSGTIDVFVEAGQEIMFRWRDVDNSGSDQGLAIDDLSITPKTGVVLSLVKSVTPTTNVAYHGNVTYTLVLRNAGGLTETAAFLTDTLPAAVDFASWVEQNGATVTDDEITWNGELAPTSALTFTFVATHVGDYGDVVTNTARFSGTAQAGTAEAVFSVEENLADVTLVYHDLEDVVHSGEILSVTGPLVGGWGNSVQLLPDAGAEVFSTTLTGLPVGNSYQYKYVVNDGTNDQWDWLNTANRVYTVTGSTTLHDYRNVVVGWANLQWPPATQVDLGTATEQVYGRLFVSGVTTGTGAGRGLQAAVGYGTGDAPAAWTWFPMVYNTDDGPSNDEFMGVMTPTAGGVYSYAVRFDGNWGTGNPYAGWTYGDLDGVYPGDPFELEQTGVLTVVSWDLGLAKSAAPAEVYLHTGESALVTYTLRVDNLSTVTDTTRFTVSDVLPEGFVYVSDDSGIAPTGTGADDDPLVWAFTTPLTHGNSLTFQVVVSATDAILLSGRYTNTATVVAEPADWVATNNTAAAGVMVYRVLSVGEARQQPLNSLVVVEGIVTAEPGIFKESSNPNRKMYIQDATGGLQIYRAAQLPTVARSEVVRVTGVISEYRTEMECIVANTTDVVDLGAGVAVTPQVTQTGAIGEPLEGQLVTVEGFITDKPNAYSFQVNDGSGNVWVYRYYNLGQTSDPNYIDFSALLVGDYVRVTGVTRGYDYSGVVRREVLPRGPADVQELYPVSFVYHDLEGVIPSGVTLHVAGDLNGWSTTATPMTGDSVTGVYTASVILDVTAPYTMGYKLVAGDNWNDGRGDILNTDNRQIVVTGPATVQLYRNIRSGYAKLNSPAAITINLGETTPAINGESWFSNIPFGTHQVLNAQIGYGTDSNPANWTWVNATFSGRNGNNDIFTATLTPATAGVYSYTIRFNGNWGTANPNSAWYLGDLDGVHPGDPFELEQTGVLIVNAPNLTTSAKVSSAAGGAVQPGALVTYTVTLNNTGATATVRVTDTLGAYYTVFSAGDFQQPVTGTLTWSGVVTAGQSVTLHFVAQVKAMAQLPLGTTTLHNIIQVDDGLAAPFNVADANPPTVTVRAIYIPLVLRNK